MQRDQPHHVPPGVTRDKTRDLLRQSQSQSQSQNPFLEPHLERMDQLPSTDQVQTARDNEPTSQMNTTTKHEAQAPVHGQEPR